MQDPRKLIVRAYDDARRSGKLDWRLMTAAVLKNRLLDLTNREFDEVHYGASTFMEFIARYPDLLSVDDRNFPPTVELHGSEAEQLSPPNGDLHPAPYHIRSDLWQAALDYSSGAHYVWDDEKQEARRSLGSEHLPLIDTVSYDLQRRWRREFLDNIKQPLNITEYEALEGEQWLQLHLGTSRLPARLVPHWNRFFRDSVLRFLRNWFSHSGLQVPDDLVSTLSRRSATTPSETEKLRELVISTARMMTHKELSELKLPSEAVLRATKRRDQ